MQLSQPEETFVFPSILEISDLCPTRVVAISQAEGVVAASREPSESTGIAIGRVICVDHGSRAATTRILAVYLL